jgi:hypothetical protein
MQKIMFVLSLSLVASVAVFVMTSAAIADDDETPCVGALPPGTYEDVVVPEGATCTMNNAIVEGNIKALENSRLSINNSMIKGNVEVDKGDQLEVFNSTVRENILVEGGSDPAGEFSAAVCGSTVQDGNIQIVKWRGRVNLGGGNAPFLCSGVAATPGNRVQGGNIRVEDSLFTGEPLDTTGPPFKELFIQNNTVEENVQVFKNGGEGGKVVNNNAINKGTIYCKENDEPFVGAPNAGRADPADDNQCEAEPLP